MPAHLLYARGPLLDWERPLRRFGAHWRVLASHVLLFDFIYPSERARIAPALRAELLRRALAELDGPAPAERVCGGTLLSRAQCLQDVERWGCLDARLAEGGPMSKREVQLWTAAIAETPTGRHA